MGWIDDFIKSAQNIGNTIQSNPVVQNVEKTVGNFNPIQSVIDTSPAAQYLQTTSGYKPPTISQIGENLDKQGNIIRHSSDASYARSQGKTPIQQQLNDETAGNNQIMGMVAGSIGGEPETGLVENELNKGTQLEKPVSNSIDYGNAIPPKQTITRVNLKPSIYGAGREAAVQNTVDNYVPGATATEQYNNLEKTMQDFGNQIQAVMQNDPKTASIDDIMKNYDKNLNNEGIYRTTKIAKDIIQKEARSYVTDIYNSAAQQSGDIVPNSISDQALYNLKKSVNQDYQSVAKKIENGTSLTDREKVIMAARQTIDDTLTDLHPAVKDLTTKQSHLYDAADSLYKGREVEMNTPPIPKQGFGDTVKNILTNPVVDVLLGGGLVGGGKGIANGISSLGGLINSEISNNNKSIPESKQISIYQPIQPTDIGIEDDQSHATKISQYQAAIDNNKLNNPNAANAAQAQLDQENATYNSQGDMRTQLKTFNNVTNLANNAISTLKSAPSSILNNNQAFQQMLTANSGPYAEFAGNLKVLSNAVGVDLTTAKSPEALQKVIDVAISKEKANLKATKSIYNNDQSSQSSSNQSQETSLPDINHVNFNFGNAGQLPVIK